MGFQHMTKAARRRIQSKGGKASRKGWKLRAQEDVAKHIQVHKRLLPAAPISNGPERFRALLTPTDDLLKDIVARIQQAERERIKAQILKVIG